MAALIGALRVSLSAETAQFEAGMKRAQRTAHQTRSSFQKAFTGLGATVAAGLAGVISGLSIGLIVRGVRAALDYAGSLKEVSQQLGVTTRDLQVLRFAAGQVGVSQEQLETGLSKLTITLGKVAAGAKAPIAALNAIGISVDQIKGKDTGEAFRIIADALQKVTDRSQRAAVEVALFGRAGAQLDNLLAGGSDAINELALAAEKLGIVLSDEQIQKADDTADKLDALKTVISANIAGAVADNADSILQLANALAAIIRVAAQATGALAAFFAQATRPLPQLGGGTALGTAFGLITNPGATIGKIGAGLAAGGGGPGDTVILHAAKRKAPVIPSANIGKFLAGGGGGKKGGRAPRDTSLRDAFQFEEDQRRLDMDILRAKQDLATDYVARTAISVQMLNLEREGFEAELKFRVASKELTQAQADILRAKNDSADALRRQALSEEMEARRAEDYAALDQLDFDLQRDKLESEAQLAETSSERRDVELRLLDLAYKQERARLEAIVAEEEAKDIAQQNFRRLEEARRQLVNLGQTFGNDRQGVIQGTRGPMEDYLATITSAEKLNEAFEQLQVQGFEGLIDSALALTQGFDDAGKALLQTLQSFLLGFLRLQLQQSLGSLLGTGFTGLKLPGFASGGSMILGGFRGIDRNIISVNGLPVARANYGERMTFSNDNSRNGGVGRGPLVQNFNFPNSDYDSFRHNQRQVARDARRRLALP